MSVFTRNRAPGARRLAALFCMRATALVAALATVVFGALALPRPAAAQAVKAEVSVAVDNGYARLVFHLAEEVESQVRLTNNILAISFTRPIDIAVDRMNAGAAGYISAARRDPDGKAVRIALARKVTMNSMAVGERLFVDLLPDSWSGPPPGLPAAATIGPRTLTPRSVASNRTWTSAWPSVGIPAESRRSRSWARVSGPSAPSARSTTPTPRSAARASTPS